MPQQLSYERFCAELFRGRQIGLKHRQDTAKVWFHHCFWGPETDEKVKMYADKLGLQVETGKESERVASPYSAVRVMVKTPREKCSIT
jgi:hypothetical protein